MPHGAADDAAQHVAALLVRRHHAVGDEERHRAAVLGEDPQRDVAVARREPPYAHAGRLLGRGDQRPEHVDVPDRVDALEDREVALEPGAGVDARARAAATSCAVGLRVELHEHEVPDLDVAVLARSPGRRRGRSSGPRSQKISELGPHGPVSAMRQKLSVAEALDALGRAARRVAPDPAGLVVGVVHGDPETLGVERRGPRCTSSQAHAIASALK